MYAHESQEMGFFKYSSPWFLPTKTKHKSKWIFGDSFGSGIMMTQIGTPLVWIKKYPLTEYLGRERKIIYDAERVNDLIYWKQALCDHESWVWIYNNLKKWVLEVNIFSRTSNITLSTHLVFLKDTPQPLFRLHSTGRHTTTAIRISLYKRSLVCDDRQMTTNTARTYSPYFG